MFLGIKPKPRQRKSNQTRRKQKANNIPVGKNETKENKKKKRQKHDSRNIHLMSFHKSFLLNLAV